MGFIIKFFLFFLAIYLFLKAFGTWLLGKQNKQNHSRYSHQQSRTKPPKQPESQQDRIIDYQKKNFESSEVEDADFVEIKEK